MQSDTLGRPDDDGEEERAKLEEERAEKEEQERLRQHKRAEEQRKMKEGMPSKCDFDVMGGDL